jgi:hypothetical protein
MLALAVLPDLADGDALTAFLISRTSWVIRSVPYFALSARRQDVILDPEFQVALSENVTVDFVVLEGTTERQSRSPKT